jgi:hypothetical protein
MVYEKATRIAQEKTQVAAQEVERIKQEVTEDSRKAKKAEGYRVTMEKLGKLPPCPKPRRGGECNGIPCEEEEPGFPYSHIDVMVVFHDKLHMSMATRDGWVASEEDFNQTSCKTSCKKLRRGNLGREECPPKQPQQPEDWEATARRRWEQDPAAAAAATASRATAAAAATTTQPRPPESDREVKS